jgi:polo-like kinase 1
MSRVLQPLDVNIQNSKAPLATNPEICSPGPKKVIVGIRASTNGEKVVAEYILSAFLGKGAFAQCFKMRDRQTGQVYAGKVIEKARLDKPHSKQKLITEIKIHKSLKHQNIVQFHSFFQDATSFYILLEMCNQKTLRDVVRQRKTITEAEARYYLIQTIDAVRYLHSKNIIHRDLKLDNIFIHDMKIKIGDFGLAAQLKQPDEKKRTLCGTPNYIAPEVLDQSGPGHSFEVDVWAIGVILYSLLIGKPPFETKTVEETYSRIRANNYGFPADKPISNEAKELITKLLHPQPAMRPKIDEILSHPFFFKRHVPSHLNCSALFEVPAAEIINSPKKSPSRKRKFSLEDNSEKQASKICKFDSNTSPTQAIKRMSLNKVPHTPSTAALEKLHKALSSHIASLGERKTRRSSSQAVHHTDHPINLWISKWVDYSYKFGLGYQFCDGTIAVSFNDATRISLAPTGNKIDFIDQPTLQSPSKPVRVLIPNKHKEYDSRAQKRITLLNYFKAYLIKCGESQGLESAGADVSVTEEGDYLPHVAAWKRTKDAILFHLSNNSVQINFHDHTKIVVSQEPNIVTFVDKKGTRSTHYLSDCTAPSEELLRRLKYVDACLQQLIQANAAGSLSTELNVAPLTPPTP